MKKIIFIICLLTLGFGTAIGANKRVVTLSIKKASLLVVLKEIREQTGVDYLMNSSHGAIFVPVTVDLKNVELGLAVKEIMKNQPVDYIIVSDCIVIRSISFNFGLVISIAVASLAGIIGIIYFSQRDFMRKV